MVKKTALHNIFIAALHCIAMNAMPTGTYVLVAQSMKSIPCFMEKEDEDEQHVIGGKKGSWSMYSGTGNRHQLAVM
jgi:hypothetical protein